MNEGQPKPPLQSQEQPPPPLPPSARNDPEVQRILNAATRSKHHAQPVGVGVHRQYVAPAPKPNVADPAAKATQFETGPSMWSETASLKDQIQRGEEYYKTDKVEVQVFDLSNADQLKKYNEILTKANKPDTNVVIMHSDRQFSAATGNWMALLELQFLLYRKVIITDENKHEKASAD